MITLSLSGAGLSGYGFLGYDDRTGSAWSSATILRSCTQQVIEDVDDGADISLGPTVAVLQSWIQCTYTNTDLVHSTKSVSWECLTTHLSITLNWKC